MKKSKAELASELLKSHRAGIDKIDEQILKLLGKRFGIVRKVAKVKIKHDIPSYLGGRVEEVRENAVRNGKKYGIDAQFLRTLYTLIIYQSCATEDILKHEAGQKPKKKKAKKRA